MDKSYSILIHPQQGTRIRHLVVSRSSIRFLTCTVLALLGLGGWLVTDYFRMKFELEEIKILGDQLKVEVATLRTQVMAQREILLSLKERTETSQQLLAKTKLERDDLKVQGAHLSEKVTALSAGLKDELAAVNARHQEEVTMLRTRLKDGLAAMKAEHQGEVTELKSKYNEELNTLRAQVQVQQEKLVALRDRRRLASSIWSTGRGCERKSRILYHVNEDPL